MTVTSALHDALKIEDDFFFLNVRQTPASTDGCEFFTLPLPYTPFFADFGPISISTLWKCCAAIDSKRKECRPRSVCFCCAFDLQYRTNAVYMISAYSVLLFGKTGEEAYRPFLSIYPPLLPFRDASYGVSTFSLTVLDCVCGLYKALRLGWVPPPSAMDEYDHFDAVENGDWNWIIPDKFIAFSSPHDPSSDAPLWSPAQYLPVFRARNVRRVVRLNSPLYNKDQFTHYGIDHSDLIYPDGSTPSDAILARFLSIAETCSGVVAVHCKAGLGRTGTLIGAYIIKHYGFTAEECIAHLRIQRPGCVLGEQQHFLKEMEGRLWKQGEDFRKKAGSKNKAVMGAPRSAGASHNRRRSVHSAASVRTTLPSLPILPAAPISDNRPPRSMLFAALEGPTKPCPSFPARLKAACE
eukprot:NODE_1995_length_1312_cov_30.671730_g1898_i0.p1 GENE.NODE_1995_length_1312_cov_30.671730_g1898_i0~~NODE_1995_length_1312_cov_30.671730_g1898_i0.p1  ORF type:complete len:423 (+),score=91.71 NODE_1995_length_1312_cov_30.671730_g1898_i0:40-1269(+)